jgi:hypothetical protein
MNKQISLSLLAAAGALVAFQSSAQAASFTASDAKAQCALNTATSVAGSFYGGSTCVVNGFTLKATTNSAITGSTVDRNITYKEVAGFSGLGVRDGANPDPSSGEIDFDEVLSVNFARALTLKSFDLSFLYQPGVFNDAVFEVALVKAAGGTQTGKLRVTGDTSAVWEATDGTVVNLSPSLKGSGGSYSVLNPFGDEKITGFSMTAVKVQSNDSTIACSGGGNCPSGGANSDFVLSAVQVPEPTTVAGLGIVGLLAFARRRRVAN